MPILGVLLLLGSCSKNGVAPTDPFDPSKSKEIKNQSYGAAAWQKADIYLPVNRSTATKTVVLIHGGFWSGGDKSEMDALINPIQNEDPTLAIININYRLADGTTANRHPAQMTDFESLLDYLDNNAATWHIGKNYALIGISAGGHLAMLFCYAYDAKHRIKTVASVIGPTNLSDPFYTNNVSFQLIIQTYLGKTWAEDNALHISASPSRIIKAGAAPTFMAYGGIDPIVPLSNPEALKTRLIALGIPYSYHIYPGEGHDMSTAAIKDIITKMSVFFKQHL